MGGWEGEVRDFRGGGVKELKGGGIKMVGEEGVLGWEGEI